MHLLVIALFALFAVAAASPLETNAQRLARGLPPRSPKFGRTLPGFAQARDNPTPAFGALLPRSSHSPSSYSGKIAVRTSDNSLLGYVKNWASLPHIDGVNFGVMPGQDLLVTFSPSGGGTFDILATNPNFPAPFYVGIGSATQTLAIGSRTTVGMVNVEKTPIPSKTDTESAVWLIDPDTDELTVQYVNPDGSLPKTTIAYDIRANRIFFVGDLEAYNFQNDIKASPVKFFLVEV